MESPQPPDQPISTPPPIGGAQPAPPTEPGEVTQQNAVDPGTAQETAQQSAVYGQAAAQQQPAYQQQPYAPPAPIAPPAQPYTAAPGGYQQPYAQPGFPPPAPYAPPGAYYAQPGYYQPYYSGPDNGLANASLITGVISIAALIFTGGFSAPLSLIASIIAIVLGHKGKKAVDEGRTRKSRDVAVGGFWTGIAGVVLSVLAVALWVIFFVAIASTGGEADPGDLASLWEVFGMIFGA